MAQEQAVILAESNPSSYLDYLIQDGKKAATYNSPGMQLLGTEQYWLHGKELHQDVDSKKPAVETKFCPLDKGVDRLPHIQDFFL